MLPRTLQHEENTKQRAQHMRSRTGVEDVHIIQVVVPVVSAKQHNAMAVYNSSMTFSPRYRLRATRFDRMPRHVLCYEPLEMTTLLPNRTLSLSPFSFLHPPLRP